MAYTVVAMVTGEIITAMKTVLYLGNIAKEKRTFILLCGLWPRYKATIWHVA